MKRGEILQFPSAAPVTIYLELVTCAKVAVGGTTAMPSVWTSVYSWISFFSVSLHISIATWRFYCRRNGLVANWNQHLHFSVHDRIELAPDSVIQVRLYDERDRIPYRRYFPVQDWSTAGWQGTWSFSAVAPLWLALIWSCCSDWLHGLNRCYAIFV